LATAHASKNLCFIVTSYWAYGELAIAMDFASRARDGGHNALFVIPPSHESIVKQSGFDYMILLPKSKKINIRLLNAIEKTFRPDMVILSDFLNYVFCEAHYGLQSDDLAIFSGKIGAFDIYDFGSSQGKVDTYGFLARNMQQLSVDRYDVLLQPCPVNHTSGKAGKIFRYKLFGTLRACSEEERSDSREKLGIAKKEKLVLLTSAIWQQQYRLYEDIAPFIRACNKNTEAILRALGPEYKIVSVGAQSLFTEGAPDNFRHFDKLPPARFREVAASCDVCVSNNYISTSMARAVLEGIPVLLLSNSIVKSESKEQWLRYDGRQLPAILDECRRAYPFRMFPVGWYGFLKDIVKNNPFYSLMMHAELFHTEDAVERIERLASGSSDFSLKRKSYIDRLENLPGIEEVFSI
jgi:hypothetical protein